MNRTLLAGIALLFGCTRQPETIPHQPPGGIAVKAPHGVVLHVSRKEYGAKDTIVATVVNGEGKDVEYSIALEIRFRGDWTEADMDAIGDVHNAVRINPLPKDSSAVIRYPVSKIRPTLLEEKENLFRFHCFYNDPGERLEGNGDIDVYSEKFVVIGNPAGRK